MEIALCVTAHLGTPVIGIDTRAMMLDAPLSWAYAQQALAAGEELEPVTRQHAPDFPLPLARWEQAGTWGWCTSAGQLDIAAHVAAQIRRKPATHAMARYTADRANHAGLGPTKARDTTLAAVLATHITWQVLATDRADLEDLLALVTNLGGRHRNDFGHVSRWVIEPGHNPEAWRDRQMPPVAAARAPYWHPARRII